MKRPTNTVLTLCLTALIVSSILTFLLAFLYGYAYVIIWALNTIFTLNINFNFFTGLAVILLTGLLKIKN